MELDTSGIKNELVCIEYPGVVKNVDKMFDTLGGLPEVSKVLLSKNRRMELRFRPDDPYCKPVCGDQINSNKLLLRIKVRIGKDKDTGESQATGSVSIVGRVISSIKFKAMCDFQYLPMHLKEDGELQDLSCKIFPQELSSSSIENWVKSPLPPILLPPVFCRIDHPSSQSYMYRNMGNEGEDSQVIGRTRKPRSSHTTFMSFDCKFTPARPKEKALKYLKVKMLSKELEIIQKKFEERPVWSKLGLMCETQVSRDALKFVLPAVAYYFINGPFRIMWSKFGYDPRKHPEAKMYQTLDFRMRSLAGLKGKIKAKRNYTSYLLPNKAVHPKSRTANITLSQKELDESSNITEEKLRGDEYIFTPTTVPPSRQMFYQYMDLKLPEIESLFARLPPDPEEAVCDPRTGFLPRGFDVHCRNLIIQYVVNNLKKLAGEKSLEGIGSGEEIDKEVGASSQDDFDDDDEDEEEKDSWQVENVDEEDINSSEEDE